MPKKYDLLLPQQRSSSQSAGLWRIKTALRVLSPAVLIASTLALSVLAVSQETITLRPQLKSEPLGDITDTFSLLKLQAAIGRNTIVKRGIFAATPSIVSIGGGFNIASQKDLVLVAGTLEPRVSEYSIFRLGEIHTRLVDNQDNNLLRLKTFSSNKAEETTAQAQELEFIGTAVLLAKPLFEKPADNSQNSTNRHSKGVPQNWFRVISSIGVIREGDVIVPEPALHDSDLASTLSKDFLAKHEQRLVVSLSPSAVQGSVLSFFSGRKWGAKQTSMVIDRGRNDGLTRGMLIAIEASNHAAEDVGEAIIYSHTPHFSLALILSASQPIERGSRVKGTEATAP